MFSSANRSCLFSLCILIFVISSIAPAQDFAPATADNARQFIGTWKASFQGHQFLTVTLSADGTRLVGTVSHVDIEVDKAGELTKADPTEGADPIAKLRVSGDTLRIAVKSGDDSDGPIESEIKLVGADEADFRLVVPPDVPAPRPWRLQRTPAK